MKAAAAILTALMLAVPARAAEYIMNNRADFITSDFDTYTNDTGTVTADGDGFVISAEGATGVQRFGRDISAADSYVLEFDVTATSLAGGKSLGIDFGTGDSRVRLYVFTDAVANRAADATLMKTPYDIGGEKHSFRLSADKTSDGWSYSAYVDGRLFGRESAEKFTSVRPYVKFFCENDATAVVRVGGVSLVSGRKAGDELGEYFLSTAEELAADGWSISGGAVSGAGVLELDGTARHGLDFPGWAMRTEFDAEGVGTARICSAHTDVELALTGGRHRYSVVADGEKYEVYRDGTLEKSGISAAPPDGQGVEFSGSGLKIRSLTSRPEPVSGMLTDGLCYDGAGDVRVISFDYSLSTAAGSIAYGDIKITADGVSAGGREWAARSEPGAVYALQLAADTKNQTCNMTREINGVRTVIFRDAAYSTLSGQRLSWARIYNHKSVYMSRPSGAEYFYSKTPGRQEGWSVQTVLSGRVLGADETVYTKEFAPPPDAYAAEIAVAAKNNGAVEIANGRNAVRIDIQDGTLTLDTARGAKTFEIGGACVLRIEQSGGRLRLLRTADGAQEEIAAGEQALPDAASAHITVRERGGAKFSDIRISDFLPRAVQESEEKLSFGNYFYDGFEKADDSWSGTDGNVYIKDGAMRIAANGSTKPQLLTRGVNTIDGVVYRTKYMIENADTTLGMMLLDSEKRAVIYIKNGHMTYRDGVSGMYDIAVPTEPCEWYELRLETTADGRYSVYRRGSEGYECLVDGAYMQPWTKEKTTYIKYFIENSADAAANIDDAEFFDAAAVTRRTLEEKDGAAVGSWLVEGAGSLLRPVNNLPVLRGILGIYSGSRLLDAVSALSENGTLTGDIPDGAAAKLLLWTDFVGGIPLGGANKLLPQAAAEMEE